MKFKLYFIIFLFFFPLIIVCQDKYYIIYFKDKNQKGIDISECLSEKAIDRRLRDNIEFDQIDLPVNKEYIAEICSVSKDSEIILTSRWLNCAVIKCGSETSFNYDFISQIFIIDLDSKLSDNKTDEENIPEYEELDLISFNYGACEAQYRLVNGIYLHNEGYTGKNVTIAVIDDGFYGVNNASYPFKNTNIIGTKNFITNTNVYSANAGYHGTMCLSLLAANLPGLIIGTAPNANYLLLKSEDTSFESILEEYAWVAAAEYADSCGVDIISSSLNYTEFDDPSTSHTYDKLDGKSCPITIGAEIAASRGIIVVNSAGNYGNSPWKYIGAPADGANVIAVGGVSADSSYYHVSSIGPTADNRFKPDLCALGSQVTVLYPLSGTGIFEMSGTSFAAPVIAGFTACVMEANPNISSTKIKSSLYSSCHQKDSPNNQTGRGIPDFQKTLRYAGVEIYKKPDVNIYPNPCSDYIIISSIDEIKRIEILSINGSQLLSLENSTVNNITIRLNEIKDKILIVKITLFDNVYYQKIMKE
ncbi:MAG: S8 family peptidase [Bacteroidales bacterium]|jgi:hypothetical protein|nr:S8 family peptidase [Bacteroidales bacterium]